ncbi:MAG: hypothetical protein GTO17_06885 [Candidatus Aminicenantes bacterium]|nr:hypothetical protein [Candidatus Aminicenantes bacterium]
MISYQILNENTKKKYSRAGQTSLIYHLVKSMQLIILGFVIILVLAFTPVEAQLKVEPVYDPAKVEFIYDDLHNFLKAFKMINEGADLEETLKKEYLDKASPGLKNYMEDAGYELKHFVERFEKYKKNYTTLPELPNQLVSQEPHIRKALQGMKKIFPKPVFIPIYILVGISGGLHAEPSEVGIRLAFSRAASPDRLPRLKLTIIHELIHVQQALAIGMEQYHSIYEENRSLLAVSIREGVAEYLTYLISGEYSKKGIYDYIKKDEKKIWERFKAEMHAPEFGDWLFSKPKDPDQPRDLGYIMGAMIVESYYENADDKKKAIDEILSITDYKGFLKKSRYAEKFLKQ